MQSLSWLWLVVLWNSAAVEPEGVAVIPLVAKRVPVETVAILDDLLLTSIGQAGKFRPLGLSDINAMLGVEKVKEVTGCNEVSCAAEIGGALGVGWLVTGSVSKLGDNVIVTLSLIDAKQHVVKRRSKAQVANDENLYLQAIELAVCQLFETRPDCGALAQAPRTEAPEPNAVRGYQQFQNDRLVKSEPTLSFADAIIDCVAATKKYAGKVKVLCSFDSKPIGYELYWDGVLAGYEPGWDLKTGQANCRWNLETHKTKEVQCRFEGVDVTPGALPSASIKSCVLAVTGGMAISGAWKDIVDTADWKQAHGCIWRIWIGRNFVATWTHASRAGGTVILEVDQLPLTDNLGKWSQAVVDVNGKRFELGAVSAGLSTTPIDITQAVVNGQNTLNISSADGTNLLHGLQAIRVTAR